MLKRLREDLKQAMIMRDQGVKVVLQGLIGAYTLAEKEAKHELSEQEGLAVIQKEYKMYMEAYEGAKLAGREDLMNQARLQIQVIEDYMPKMLSEDEILAEATALIMAQSLDTSNKGLLMKTLMPIFKGRADGKLVNQVISGLVK